MRVGMKIFNLTKLKNRRKIKIEIIQKEFLQHGKNKLYEKS
jgi:hypothetical protein